MKQTNAITIAIVIVALIGFAAYLAYRMNDNTNTALVPPTSLSTSPNTNTNTSSNTPPASQGKININVVCDGVLTYMTFADAASADAFVAECKEGKHPEVIEKFKASLNVGSGATI